MSFELSKKFQLSEFINNALREDVGQRDVTTEAIISPDSRSMGVAILNEGGTLSGIEIFFSVFRELDSEAVFSTRYKDGDSLPKGTEIASVECRTRAILTGERTALNILQRMCGIATLTASFVEKIASTNTKILDTRKTVPGLRYLDKYAVTCGGGRNHRTGLFDGILIKDNHIKAAGSIKNAVEKVRGNAPQSLAIEVETETPKQIEEALESRVDIIMLDNMSAEEVRESVKMIGGRAQVEVSGGINLESVGEYALAGPDFISVGALTHSVRAVDISLNINTV